MPVVSISYGDCEPNFTTTEINSLVAMGQQANAQGQTIVGPSGDSSAADCDYPLTATSTVTSAKHGLAVDVPAALPYVTGVGGGGSATTSNSSSSTTTTPQVGTVTVTATSGTLTHAVVINVTVN